VVTLLKNISCDTYIRAIFFLVILAVNLNLGVPGIVTFAFVAFMTPCLIALAYWDGQDSLK
jgi:hypothetical protein